MKILRSILPILFLVACGLRTFKLHDGIYKAAINSKVYSNKNKFDKSILLNLDTSAIYEEYSSFYIGKKIENTLERLNYQSPNTIYGIYRFYENGCFSYFLLDRNDSTLLPKFFDPEYTGWRGVYYRDDGKIKGDLITQVSGIGEIGLIKETFRFNGDTLLVTSKNRMSHMYLKRKIPMSLLLFHASW